MESVGKYPGELINAVPLVVARLVRWKDDRKVDAISRSKQTFGRAMIAVHGLGSGEQSAAEVAERRLPVLPEMGLGRNFQSNLTLHLRRAAKRRRTGRIVRVRPQGAQAPLNQAPRASLPYGRWRI